MAKVRIESPQESPKVYDVRGEKEITVKTKNETPEVTVGGGGGGGGGGDGMGCLGCLILLFLLIGGLCAGLEAICKAIWPPQKTQVVKTIEESGIQTPPRKILFVSNQNENKEICLIDTSGSVVNLTSHPAVNLRNRSIKDWNPAPSPDGQKIAFVSDRNDWKSNIYVIDIDGANLVHIIGQAPFSYSNQEDKKLLKKSEMGHPAWISNTEIIFDYTLPRLPSSWILGSGSTLSFPDPERGTAEIEIELCMKIPSDTVYEKITKKNNDRYYKYTNPAVSPDKRHIACIKRVYIQAGLVNTVEISSEIIISSSEEGVEEISLAGFRDGWSLTLTSQAWSPNGDKIVFSENSRIGIIELNNSPRTIWFDVNGKNPSWAPNGKWIAFDRKGELYILEVETNRIKKIIGNKLCGENPIWIPY